MAIKIVPAKVNMDKPIMIKPYDSEGNMLAPAVTFEPNRISYSDGGKVENGGIYSTLLDINATLLDYTAEDLSTGVDPEFIANNINMISELNSNILEDSFCNSIYSHYCVFMGKVNSIINSAYNGNPPITVKTMNTHDFIFLHNRYLDYAMHQFTKNDLYTRDAILNSHAFVDMCVAFVNTIGRYAYNDAMLAISEVLATTSFDWSTDPKDRMVIPIINREFSTMMGDMTYEISAFVHNVKIYHALIFSKEEITNVKYLNNSEMKPPEKTINKDTQDISPDPYYDREDLF